MNTLSFKVELLFADPITKDTHIMEVANNILAAIINQAREASIAPEDETYTVEVKVTSIELSEMGYTHIVQAPIIGI